MYFEKNLRALASNKKNLPTIEKLQRLLTEPDPMAGAGSNVPELVPTDTDGDYTLVYRDCYLHSPENAQAEARELVETKATPGQTHNCHLLLGLGLGYVLDSLFQFSGGRIFIFEPHHELLMFALENVDLSTFFGSGRVMLATTFERTLEQMDQEYVFGGSLDLLLTDGYKQLIAAEIPGWMEQLKKFLSNNEHVVAMQYTFNAAWTQEFFRNLRHYPEALPFESLRGVHKDQKALIVSSGPSLQDALPEIAKAKDHMVIIAVVGAVRALMKAGIVPDYIVALDMNGPRKFLKDLPMSTKDSRFILSPFAEALCFEYEAAGHFVIKGNAYEAYGVWSDKILGTTQQEVRNGGTVSAMALEAAIAMGCKTVSMIGLDLSLRNGQIYAGIESQAKIENGRIILPESNEHYAYDRAVVHVEGWNGEELVTLPDYRDFRNNFEATLVEYKKEGKTVQLYNCSVGGAYIKGFEHLSFGEMLVKEQPAPLHKPFQNLPAVDEAQRQATLKRLTTNLEPLSEATTTCLLTIRKAMTLYERLKESKDKRKAEGENVKRHTSQEVRWMEQLFQAFDTVTELMEAHDLIGYMLFKEHWKWYVNHDVAQESLDDHYGNLSRDYSFYQQALPLLENHLAAWLQEVQRHVDQKYRLEAAAAA